MAEKIRFSINYKEKLNESKLLQISRLYIFKIFQILIQIMNIIYIYIIFQIFIQTI